MPSTNIIFFQLSSHRVINFAMSTGTFVGWAPIKQHSGQQNLFRHANTKRGQHTRRLIIHNRCPRRHICVLAHNPYDIVCPCICPGRHMCIPAHVPMDAHVPPDVGLNTKVLVKRLDGREHEPSVKKMYIVVLTCVHSFE